MEWDGKAQSWPSWGRDLGLCGSTRGPPFQRSHREKVFWNWHCQFLWLLSKRALVLPLWSVVSLGAGSRIILPSMSVSFQVAFMCCLKNPGSPRQQKEHEARIPGDQVSMTFGELSGSFAGPFSQGLTWPIIQKFGPLMNLTCSGMGGNPQVLTL